MPPRAILSDSVRRDRTYYPNIIAGLEKLGYTTERSRTYSRPSNIKDHDLFVSWNLRSYDASVAKLFKRNLVLESGWSKGSMCASLGDHHIGSWFVGDVSRLDTLQIKELKQWKTGNRGLYLSSLKEHKTMGIGSPKMVPTTERE